MRRWSRSITGNSRSSKTSACAGGLPLDWNCSVRAVWNRCARTCSGILSCYRPLGADAERESSVTDAEAEIGYYQGEGLLLEDVLREQVLLALPLKVTCRADCKGIVSGVREEFEPGAVFVLQGNRRSALGGAERCPQPAGAEERLLAVSS